MQSSSFLIQKADLDHLRARVGAGALFHELKNKTITACLAPPAAGIHGYNSVVVALARLNHSAREKRYVASQFSWHF